MEAIGEAAEGEGNARSGQVKLGTVPAKVKPKRKYTIRCT